MFVFYFSSNCHGSVPIESSWPVVKIKLSKINVFLFAKEQFTISVFLASIVCSIAEATENKFDKAVFLDARQITEITVFLTSRVNGRTNSFVVRLSVLKMCEKMLKLPWQFPCLSACVSESAMVVLMEASKHFNWWNMDFAFGSDRKRKRLNLARSSILCSLVPMPTVRQRHLTFSISSIHHLRLASRAANLQFLPKIKFWSLKISHAVNCRCSCNTQVKCACCGSGTLSHTDKQPHDVVNRNNYRCQSSTISSESRTNTNTSIRFLQN